MNFALQIIQLALSLLQAHFSGSVEEKAAIAGILVQILQKAAAAYQDHTGQTLDPSLIKQE
jgi:hypothetical protein